MQPRQVFRAYDGIADERADFCLACGASLGDADHGGRTRRACEACGFIRFRNPAPGVSVLVIDDYDRVLLCRRRPNMLEGGKWCLPCGYVEFDEDHLTAAVREVREETGLDVEIASILSVCTNFLSPDVHAVVTVLLARVSGGTLRAGDDADDVRWFSRNEPLPPFAFEADSHIIERYFATRLAGAPVDPDLAS